VSSDDQFHRCVHERGIGNGVALRARVAGRHALLAMRPTLIRFSDGRSGGMIPISMGIAF
jgi:hypothetical protein